MLTMKIGNMQEFQASQLTKVERRKEEEKQIKKGIYQMQVLIDSQQEELFDKEIERSRERTKISREEAQEAEDVQNADSRMQGFKQTDLKQEMGRMMAMAAQFLMEQ